METRAAQEAETRLRIVEAAMGLHAKRGILATKPAEIAARAGVALTTYYKHFRSRSELVSACTSHAGSLVRPPEPGHIAALADPRARVGAMVEALFEFYQVREPFLYTGRTEERSVPEVRPVMQRLRMLRDGCVKAALGDAEPKLELVSAATALVDFWAWRTLRRDLNLTQLEAIGAVTVAVLRVAGVDAPERGKNR